MLVKYLSDTRQYDERLIMSNDIKRRGFSIIELIVVLAIIAILLSLLLPAVLKARKTANGLICKNNMRQIGIAIASYESTFGKLPPSAIWGGEPGEQLQDGKWAVGILDRVAMGLAPATEEPRMMANWALMLLPYVEADNLFNLYDFSKPVSDPVNEQVRTSEVSVFKCPLDPFNGPDNHFDRMLLAGGEGNKYARGNYAINMGSNRGCFQHVDGSPTEWPVGNRDNVPGTDCYLVDGSNIFEDNTQLWGGGAAGVNKSFRVEDVESGASNFIVVDEIRAGVNPFDLRGSWALGFIGASVTARHGKVGLQEDGFGPNNLDEDSDDIYGCSKVKEAISSNITESNKWLRDVGMPCFSSSNPLDNEVNFQQTGRSMHPVGVHALYLDGSVSYISNNINPDVWSAHHDRLTNEIIQRVQ